MTVQAIDVHAHFGVSVDQPSELANRFMTGDAEKVVERAESSSTQYTLVSPLAAFYTSKVSEVLTANLRTSEMAAKYERLFHWVVVNPLISGTFAQAKELLAGPRVAPQSTVVMPPS